MNTYCVSFRHTPKGHAGYGYGVHVKSPDTFHLRENIYRYIEEKIGPIQLKQHNLVTLVDGSSIRIYDTVYEQRLGTGVYRFDLVEVKYWYGAQYENYSIPRPTHSSCSNWKGTTLNRLSVTQ